MTRSDDLCPLWLHLHSCCVFQLLFASRGLGSPRVWREDGGVISISKRYVVLALVALVAAQAHVSAQVTTAIFHSSRLPSAEEAKRRADSLRHADSAAMAASVLAMHRWVDSAGRSVGAGSHHNDDSLAIETSVPALATDTSVTVIDRHIIAQPAKRARIGHRTTEFHDGATAPVTATSLPLLLACGTLALVLGISLLAIPRRRLEPLESRLGRRSTTGS